MNQPGGGGSTVGHEVPCGRCGRLTDGRHAIYSNEGELICKACEVQQALDQGYVRAARSACLGALATGLVSLVFNPFWLLSIAALVQAIRAIVLILQPSYRQALGGQQAAMMAAAVGGLLLAAARPAAVGMAVVGLLVGR